MRERILAIAADEGYEFNYYAASLRRTRLKIAVIMGTHDRDSRFFVDRIADGIQRCIDANSQFNIDYRFLTYTGRDMTSAKAGQIVSDLKKETFDGVLMHVLKLPDKAIERSSRILFSGDTVNNSIILMRQPGNDPCLIEKYQRTLEKLWARHEDFDRLAIGHDGDVIDNGIIHDYLTITRGVLDGSIRGAYEEVGFRKGDVARYGKAELWFHCDA